MRAKDRRRGCKDCTQFSRAYSRALHTQFSRAYSRALHTQFSRAYSRALHAQFSRAYSQNPPLAGLYRGIRRCFAHNMALIQYSCQVRNSCKHGFFPDSCIAELGGYVTILLKIVAKVFGVRYNYLQM